MKPPAKLVRASSTATSSSLQQHRKVQRPTLRSITRHSSIDNDSVFVGESGRQQDNNYIMTTKGDNYTGLDAPIEQAASPTNVSKNVSDYGSSQLAVSVSPSMSSLSNSDSENFRTRSIVSSSSQSSPDKIVFCRSTSSNESDRTLAISINTNTEISFEGGEHFEIVWRDLSYEVPLKLFEQVKCSLSKLSNCIKSSNKCSFRPQTIDPLTPSKHMEERNCYPFDTQNNNKFDVPINLTPPNSLIGPSRSSSSSSSTSINSPTVVSSLNGDTRRRVIFSDLNGCIRSGQVTAILGPSGAGKTTFLKCLTGRISKGIMGTIEVYGNVKDKHRRLRLCMIPQRDYLLENLTVKENLLFASKIKNTDKNFDHTTNVERVVQMLRLTSCLHLKTSKISGGQHKRVSIAQELLSNPDILVLDEPTSGLDSLTCYKTVSVLQDLANLSRKGLISPLAIVLTIHQPQPKIFKLFHHVYVLSNLGQCIYEGRPDDVIGTIKESCQLIEPLTDGNPASFIIELASEEHGAEPIIALAALQRQNFSLDWSVNSDNNLDLAQQSARLADSSIDDDGISVPSHSSDHLDHHDHHYHLHSSIETPSKQSNNLTTYGPMTYAANQVEHSLKQTTNISTIDNRKRSTDASPPLVKQLYARSKRATGSHRIEPIVRRRAKTNRLPLKWHTDRSVGFWRHVHLLTCRTWLSMWRDPLLTTTRILFHLIIPFIMAVVYSSKSGKANACPNLEREFDVRVMGSAENVQHLQEQHNELILTFENTSLFFILLYSFSMCVLALTSLSFPLNMHILSKETSNGWYSLPRFVMAKTLADLPMELTMPLLTMALVYPLTNQPTSYMNWRMLSITLVMTMCSLISQTQGLIFGALFMNNVQTAVFVSQASSLPWILLSGFTTRVSELPQALRWLSFGSVYRLGIESILSIRYGFGMCPCDEQKLGTTPPRFVGIPPQVSSMFKYWLENYRSNDNDNDTIADNDPTSIANSTTTETSTTMLAPTLNSTQSDNIINDTVATSQQGDLFNEMASYLSRANTFGVDIQSCHDVRPFILNARDVDESTLPRFLIALVLILLLMKVLLFILVRLRVSLR